MCVKIRDEDKLFKITLIGTTHANSSIKFNFIVRVSAKRQRGDRDKDKVKFLSLVGLCHTVIPNWLDLFMIVIIYHTFPFMRQQQQ